MPIFGPRSRRELIAALKEAGFSGPYSGGKHQFMVRDSLRVRIPNPSSRRHQQEFARTHFSASGYFSG